jgi:kynurenine formamidase
LPNDEKQFGCFHAPEMTAQPSKYGDFELSIKSGSPVNSFDLFVNIHGRTTHTECLSHVKDDKLTIDKSMEQFFYVASLVSVDLKEQNEISVENFDWEKVHGESKALIIRTLPNMPEKEHMDYSGMNPPNITPGLMQQIVDFGILHLVVDIPSVDPENDGGKVKAHKIFWNIGDDERRNSTISEMVYIPNEIEDGLFLVNINPIRIHLDAGISRIVLYELWEEF